MAMLRSPLLTEPSIVFPWASSSRVRPLLWHLTLMVQSNWKHSDKCKVFAATGIVLCRRLWITCSLIDVVAISNDRYWRAFQKRWANREQWPSHVLHLSKGSRECCLVKRACGKRPFGPTKDDRKLKQSFQIIVSFSTRSSKTVSYQGTSWQAVSELAISTCLVCPQSTLIRWPSISQYSHVSQHTVKVLVCTSHLYICMLLLYLISLLLIAN